MVCIASSLSLRFGHASLVLDPFAPPYGSFEVYLLVGESLVVVLLSPALLAESAKEQPRAALVHAGALFVGALQLGAHGERLSRRSHRVKVLFPTLVLLHYHFDVSILAKSLAFLKHLPVELEVVKHPLLVREHGGSLHILERLGGEQEQAFNETTGFACVVSAGNRFFNVF